MKQFVRSHKLLWNLGFWILFFAVVFFVLAKPENVNILRAFGFFAIGFFLIINRIYLVKGSIKRLPYFLSFLALLFILVGIIKIMISVNSVYVFFSAFIFSYFIASGIAMMLVGVEINDLVRETMELSISSGFSFIIFLTLGFLCLIAFYPFVVLHIKRLRDIRYSYWWTLLTLVPGVHILFELFLFLKGSAKKRSKQPKRNSQKKQSKSKYKMRR